MITSVKNEKIKQWKKLHKRKEREASRLFLIEGFHLIEEAYNSNWKIQEVIVSENTMLPNWLKDIPVELVGENVLQHLSQTKTPQGIIATVEMNEKQVEKCNHVLLIDGIQDPGNLGTIIRTADAAGFHTIVLGEGTVDVYNDKVIRATQGSIFHVAIVHESLEKEIHSLQEQGYVVWASALQDAKMYHELDPTDKKIALILGNEGNGIQERWIQLADQVVKIPIHGKAESLNVSVAAGILMYYIKS